MLKKDIKVDQKIVLPTRAVKIWVIKTETDLAQEREQDRKAGRYHDDGGESILYAPFTCATSEEIGEVEVTSKKPSWNHWRKKPSFLIGGFSKKLNREVLFVMPGQ
jgi:hypothetical protein